MTIRDAIDQLDVLCVLDAPSLRTAVDMAKDALREADKIGGLGRLQELVQADREGRCVMLSTPMRPMICKPNDTDVYCPRCGETLSGGWPESDYYDYRKMVQCPNCGESIDDNKCETVERRAT